MPNTSFGWMDSLLLEAEVAPKKRSDFEKEYLAKTGTTPRVGDHYQEQSNRWGLAGRIYFNASQATIDALEAAGYHVEHKSEGYYPDYTLRVTDNALFWKLVQEGYRLGEN